MAVTQADIFNIIEKNIRAVLPDLESVAIDPQQTLTELGANSVDSADIKLQTMQHLGVSAQLHELTSNNIRDLIDFIESRLN
ncbi:phosphopantetheine-binding protein [Streptomyces sp. NPDC005827]|uniref:phosphopantetheine-binding protein n=1 Tax=Streptomyces sp. NPDC005827 TaxID=3157070 RepID=UPI0033C141C2